MTILRSIRNVHKEDPSEYLEQNSIILKIYYKETPE